MQHFLSQLIIIVFCLFGLNIHTMASSDPSVEELRLEKARQQMPEVFHGFAEVVSRFESDLQTVSTAEDFSAYITDYGHRLWQVAVAHMAKDASLDDRSLYWNRLAMTDALKHSAIFRAMSKETQAQLLWQFELQSRGQGDVRFEPNSKYKKILITGFDPFFLDRNIDQSNPSGIAALHLDNRLITFKGVEAEVQSLIFPVRFADFDQGMVETLLSEYFPQVDMIVTISMGRKDFDLERFPGRRRSAEAPDNLNVLTGADQENPLIPLLDGKPLEGPEFLEFSLPVEAMKSARGSFQVNDNAKVVTLEGKKEPHELTGLRGQIAVSGSGGGYLSNEISYRSLRLRDSLNPKLPVGHIHTPRIKAFEPNTSGRILVQINAMLRHALTALD